MIGRSKQHLDRGFSLLQLSVWLVVLGLVLAFAVALWPRHSEEIRLENTIATIGDAQDALLGFLVANSRLPEPDSDNDGFENPGASSGALPWRSMGWPAGFLDEASIPLRFVPYRNTTDSADLSAATSLYVPDLPDGTSSGCPANPVSPVNLLDFCVALENAIGAAASSTYVNTAPGISNHAYVVLSGGLEDVDGNQADASLDGLNDDGTMAFEDPARGRSAAYDDFVRVEGFATLQRELSCKAHRESLDLLVSVAQRSKEIADDAEDLLEDAETQVIIAEINFFLGLLGAGETAAAIAGIGFDIAKALPLCNVPPNVTCCPALIALGVAATAYAIQTAVQLAKLVATGIELDKAKAYRDLVRDEIKPAADAHLCAAIQEVVDADNRGGLLGAP